jgi:hypothetical protein
VLDVVGLISKIPVVFRAISTPLRSKIYSDVPPVAVSLTGAPGQTAAPPALEVSCSSGAKLKVTLEFFGLLHSMELIIENVEFAVTGSANTCGVLLFLSASVNLCDATTTPALFLNVNVPTDSDTIVTLAIPVPSGQ